MVNVTIRNARSGSNQGGAVYITQFPEYALGDGTQRLTNWYVCRSVSLFSVAV
jgi:hypothetical protein